MTSIFQNSAAVAITVLVLLLTSLVLFAPKLRLGGSTVSLHGGTAPSSVPPDEALLAEVAALRTENRQLQEAMKAVLTTSVQNEKAFSRMRVEKQAVVGCEDPTIVKVDLVKYLGAIPFLTGISYDPFVCFPSLEEVFPNSDELIYGALERCTQDLVEEMARIHGVKAEEINPAALYFQQEVGRSKFPDNLDDAIRPLTSDPKFLQWRVAVSRVLARYLVDASGHLHVNCDGVPEKEELSQLGRHCRNITDQQALQKLGFFTVPFESPNQIANIAAAGTCFTHTRNNTASYAHWIVQERLSEEWRTFQASSPEQDKVLLLFDMLHEKQLVFTKQYWMGIINMQNPFDMYSIQDIIYTTKPDLLIETGTANGGSAVMWSGIMELAGLEQSKIVTIDVEPPTWTGKVWGSAVAREDPTKDKMWQKRVTFIKGLSTDPQVVSQVQAAAQGKGSVLVTLDSGHDKANVAAEMKAYCTLVTVGSYCIVEDTKMSRWHSTGPLMAVKEFLAEHPEFEVDRSQELLYTHHAMGYLKRIK